MAGKSIFEMIGLPMQFGVLLLVVCFCLLLAPYFSGTDFGVVKIPVFPPKRNRMLKIIGPLIFILCLFLFLPIWDTIQSETAVLPASKDYDQEFRVAQKTYELAISGENSNQSVKKSGTKANSTLKINKRPKLWITYAWQDKEGGNFDFLIQQLEAVGIETTFDKVALLPGRRFWEQIENKISAPSLDGWAILLTKDSIQSESSKEELAYALDRALYTKGKFFPLLGLIHQVSIEDIPLSLRTRNPIDLSDKDWPKRVLSALQEAPLKQKTQKASKYKWQGFPNFRGDGTLAIWVRPRFEELRYWRFLFPIDTKLIDWGAGRPQKSGFTGIRTNSVEGYEGTLTSSNRSVKITMVGAGDTITPSSGCYIVFGEPFPKFVGIATAEEPFGPASMETFELIEIP